MYIYIYKVVGCNFTEISFIYIYMYIYVCVYIYIYIYIYKLVGYKLNKEDKDLYCENYKTVMKEIEVDTKKSNYIPCSWI